MSLKKVCIVGSGNWGMAIAKVIGENILEKPEKFYPELPIYVHEEIVDGQKLTDIINQKRENVKYLPGHKMPSSVKAYSKMEDVLRDSDVVVFVLPHQFVANTCVLMKPFIKKTAQCVSLIKGLDMSKGNLDLISNVIRRELNIEVGVLMGANIANEVASAQFCEATIGCRVKEMAEVLKNVFNRPYFKITVVKDEDTVEVCGALKNIVAIGAGLVDGMGFGGNTKAAVIRLGFLEIIKFNDTFFKQAPTETYLESCGFADLVTTCYNGRNRKVAEAFVKANGKKSFLDLEKDMLNGQKLQGPPTAQEVNKFLTIKGFTKKYPLLTIVHHICTQKNKPQDLITCLQTEY